MLLFPIRLALAGVLWRSGVFFGFEIRVLSAKIVFRIASALAYTERVGPRGAWDGVDDLLVEDSVVNRFAEDEMAAMRAERRTGKG